VPKPARGIPSDVLDPLKRFLKSSTLISLKFFFIILKASIASSAALQHWQLGFKSFVLNTPRSYPYLAECESDLGMRLCNLYVTP